MGDGIVIAPGVSGFPAIKMAELDGTSPAEIIAADGQWGNVTVYRYTAGAPQVLTQINSIGDGVTAIATGDVNGDPSSGAQIWQSPPLRGYVPPNSLNYYDLTGSGRLQMVFGTSVGMYVTQ